MVATFEFPAPNNVFVQPVGLHPFTIGGFSYPFVPTPPTAITVDISVIQNDGGTLLTLTGAVPDGSYNVHVGPLSSAVDPSCYSGVPGQGDTVIVVSGQFQCVAPPLPIGGSYAFFLVNVDTGATLTTAEVLDVVPHHFRSRVPSLRRVLPRHWKLGCRTVRAEEYPQQ